MKLNQLNEQLELLNEITISTLKKYIEDDYLRRKVLFYIETDNSYMLGPKEVYSDDKKEVLTRKQIEKELNLEKIYDITNSEEIKQNIDKIISYFIH